MKRMVFAGMALVALVMTPGLALASNSLLAGIFDGTEDVMDRVSGTCFGSEQLSYQDVGTFQVSAGGDYWVYDAIDYTGVDVVALIYDGQFDPDSPLLNLITFPGIDFAQLVSLVGGHEYRLVVQRFCANNETKWAHGEKGAWAVTFSGPGNVVSPSVRTVPEFTEGAFTNSDPTATTDCSSAAQYHVSGPINVSVSGTYYFQDVLQESSLGVDVCVQVYSAPFDPNNPNANRVLNNSGFGELDFDERINLEAGQDYYFVAQPWGSSSLGEYFYVLAPPAPFRINKALAGAWFNPQTNGQGVFVDVYDARNQMFVGWYTFDLSRPVDGTAQLGEAGHRWLTGLGAISGGEASLDVYLARGGAFDAVDPPIDDPQTVVGSMSLEFTDCLTGTLEYDLTTPVVSGQIPLQPLADDHVELCESIVEVPGMPGPL
jgi:hypothetical protein